METKRNERLGRKIAFFIVTAMLLGIVGAHPATNGATSLARGKISLSRTKKTYDMTGLWDKIKLNNAPAGAKIIWKSSNSKVVKIKSHITNGIWYKVLKNGKPFFTDRTRMDRLRTDKILTEMITNNTYMYVYLSFFQRRFFYAKN